MPVTQIGGHQAQYWPSGRSFLEAYYPVVLGTSPGNLIGYWPLWEVTGATAYDQSGNGRDATYINATPGASRGIGDGQLCVAMPDAANQVDAPAAAKAALNGDEGTMFIWCQVANALVWSDGVNGVILRVTGAGNNDYQCWKTNTASNRLLWSFRRNGVALQYNHSNVTDTGWMPIGISWSTASDRVRAYAYGAIIQEWTGLAAWTGGAAVQMRASYDGAAFRWHGNLAHWAIWNVELTADQMRDLAWDQASYSATFFGDSITNGTGASSDAKCWRSLVTTQKGFRLAINSGAGGTVLQNTVQNAVPTIGAAANNNGRDTYTTRVLAYRTDYVFVLYGINDLCLNDPAFSVIEFQNDLDEVVAALLAAGYVADQIVLGSPPYCNGYVFAAPWDAGSIIKHQAYVAATAAVAAANGVRYTDVYQWMIDHGGNSLISVDKIHPNDLGHAQIALAFMSVL